MFATEVFLGEKLLIIFIKLFTGYLPFQHFPSLFWVSEQHHIEVGVEMKGNGIRQLVDWLSIRISDKVASSNLVKQLLLSMFIYIPHLLLCYPEIIPCSLFNFLVVQYLYFRFTLFLLTHHLLLFLDYVSHLPLFQIFLGTSQETIL